jgi:glutathione S-transferase
VLRLFIGNKNYSSWSLRPWILMRELGIAFDEQLEALHEPDSYQRFRRFAPNGRVPCLHDGGTVVWDSLAIVEYLAERYAGVWPADATARAFARCAAAEMHSAFAALRGTCGMSCAVRVRLHRVSPELQRDLDRIDELWGEGLRRFGGPLLAGASFTAVDAFFAPVAFRILSYDLKLAPASLAYAERLRARPMMQQWYAAALAEPWRDVAHDDEIAGNGAVIEDLRASPSR